MTTDRGRPTGADTEGASLAPIDTSGLPAGTVGIRALLSRSRSQIAAALPRHITVERMLRVAMTAIQTTPGLLDCTPLSILGGVVTAAQLGLEIGGPLGQAYLIPYRINGQRVAVLIPGYRGMVDLARRSGAVSTVEARVVHQRDRFSYALGLAPRIDHVPYMGADDPGPAVAVYAICRLRDGSVQFEVMSMRDVDHVRKRSKTAGRDDSPWATDADEMIKKTAIRRLWKLLPVSVERTMEAAIRAHDGAEMGMPVDPSAVFGGGIDVQPEDLGSDGPTEPTPTRRTRREAPTQDRDEAPREERPADDIQPAEAGDPRADLVEALHRIRGEDPEAFERGFGLGRGGASRLDMAGIPTDSLLVARENAATWRAANPRR